MSSSTPSDPNPALAGRRVLFVSHEASRTGAPMFLLHFLRWLRRHTALEFDLLLAKSGPLEPAFAEVAEIVTPAQLAAEPARLRAYALIYANTACNGNLLEDLGCGGVPVITHVHELDMGYHWLGARNMAGVMRHTSQFVACAEAVAARLREVFALPPERIAVHYEMIDGAAVAANVAAAGRSARADFGIPDDAWVVTACGTFDFRKAPDLFVQAAAQLKRRLGPGRPLRFLWIGSLNTPDLVRLLREDVRKLGLEEEVRFVGELPSPHGLLSVSDVFCLTSREDPFPLIMLEAAALEKPVLAFDGSGGAPEFCALGGGLTVPYLDPGAMADLTAELLRDPARRLEIGRRAAAVVRERFVVERIAPGLWELLQDRLRHPPQAAPETARSSDAEIYATWCLEQAPQRSYVEAHLLRDCARRQAGELAGAGRIREAVQLLTRTVSADLATKEPLVIFESLVQIGDDLAAWEPNRSAQLLAEAERLSRGNPYLKLATFRARRAA